MTAKELLKLFSKIKFEEEVVEAKYAKLEDGTIVQAKDFVEGEVVNVVYEDGTLEVLADGEYTVALPEGETDVLKKMVIAEGVISAIEEIVEEPKEEPKEEEFEEEVDLKGKVEALEAKVAALEELFNKFGELVEKEIEEEEVELKKLDGAPINKFNKQNEKDKIVNKQDKFLSRLYR